MQSRRTGVRRIGFAVAATFAAMSSLPVIDRHTIRHRHWSAMVSRRDPATGETPDTFGQIVTAVDDLDQAIANLVLTPKGSVPTEPEKGVDWPGVIDRHPDIGIPTLTREIWDQLAMWEPRIVVEKVEVAQTAFAHFVTRVFWRPTASVLDDLRITEVAYDG